MSPSKVESGLVKRLERLKRGDTTRCVPEYAGDAKGITRDRGFSRLWRALVRSGMSAG